MADILPSRPELPDEEDKDPRVVGIDSDDVDELLAAISSETAREVLAKLHDEPGPPSDVAARVDTSIQNAQYHLDRLESAGLIESAGTAYSEKGREMTVYAPSDRALVVVAGNEDDTSGLQSVLTQLLGGLGVVALGSVIVDRLARRAAPAVSLGSSGGDGGSAGGAGESAGGGDAGAVDDGANLSGTAETDAPDPTATDTPAPTPTESGDSGGVQIAEATETPAPDGTGTAAPTSDPTTTPTETLADATQTAANATQTAVETTTQTAAGGDPIQGIASAVAGLPPGAFFFLGGVVALSFVALVWQR
jgi:DNA-binding transcriptional ArsR family regulator